MSDVGTTKRGRMTTRMKLAIFERERGLCMICGKKLRSGEIIFEHVRALELGGSDTAENIRLTCVPCAREKTRDDHSRAAKAKRVKSKHLGLRVSKNPLPGGRKSPWKIKMNGQRVKR